MLTRRCIVKGRVQGVGFRYFTCRIAKDAGIKGWVRNLATGDVEVHAEGDEPSMDRFMSRLKDGPSLAFVQEIEVRDVEGREYQDFTVEF